MAHMTSTTNPFETRLCGGMDARLASARAPYRAFAGASSLVFAPTALLTIVWCESMSAMPSMPMPGGWTMSMAWMRMPGQTWAAAAASFIGMWLVMMVAMMLPSLAPRLWAYRQAIGSRSETRTAWLTIIVGAGYFFVWTLFGVAVYPPGVALAAAEMRYEVLARLVPISAGVVIVLAGTIQFTSWKALHLRCWRKTAGGGCTLVADAGTGWRHGLTLGLQCIYCCANFTAVMLAIGVMDLRAMALVTAAINVERLAPRGYRAERPIGAVLIGVGLFWIAQAFRMR